MTFQEKRNALAKAVPLFGDMLFELMLPQLTEKQIDWCLEMINESLYETEALVTKSTTETPRS